MSAWRSLTATAAMLLVTSASGCSAQSADAIDCRHYEREQVRTAGPTDITPVRRPRGNLSIWMHNNEPEAVRVTVRPNGEVAVDSRLPGSPCSMHPPVEIVNFDLPASSAVVEVVTSGAAETRTVVRVGLREDKQWLDVDISGSEVAAQIAQQPLWRL